MFPNTIVSNIPGGPNNNPISDIGTALVNKSRLTKGMYFILIFDALYAAFVISYVFVSSIQEKIPFTNTDIRNSGFVLFGLTVLYFVLYSIPELRDRFKINKDKKDV